MEQEIFDILAEKYLNEEATPEEQKLIETYLDKLRTQNAIELPKEQLDQITSDIYQKILNETHAEKAKVVPMRKNRFIRWSATCSI